MRGRCRRLQAVALCGAAVFFALLCGCRTSTRSGMPGHIKTVEVHIFQNKTMYKSVEGAVTRAIIDRINMDPVVRVSSRGGDALITGEIIDISRSTLRETTTNEPGTVKIIITCNFSFYDQVQRKYLIEDAVIASTVTGEFPGIYEASHGGDSLAGIESAAHALAAEIVRRTVGMW